MMQSQASPSSSARQRKCPYCFREFTKHDHYSRHLRSHTKEKPFRCNTCGHDYARRDTLLRHLKIHEKGLEPRKWRHAFADDYDVHTTRQPGSHPNGSSSATLLNVSDEVDMVTTTASAHVRRAFNSSPGGPSIGPDGPASSLARPSNQTNFGNPHPDLSTAVDLTYWEPTTTVDVPLGQNAMSSNLFQHKSSGLLMNNAATLGDNVNSSLDTSDWLLEGEIFDLFDFSNLQSGSLDSQQMIETDVFPHVGDLRDVWYVPVAKDELDPRFGANPTSSAQASNLQDDIDEAYRADMATNLLPRIRTEPLPSIDLLNICIRLFFARINTMLPLVHGPTFRVTPNNTLLVLSICSAGTLAMGSGNAGELGCMLFERVNKAGMTLPWERILSRQLGQARSNLKVATIGQTFTLLSGEPAHRMIGNSFHGGMIASARHLKLFDATPVFELADDLSLEDLDKAWRAWANEEEMKRLALILHIQDAELAALFHQEPNFRHNLCALPAAASADLFAAPTAVVWANKYRALQKERDRQANMSPEARERDSDPIRVNPRNKPDILNAYATLSGVGASICEFRRLGLLSTDLNTKLCADLVRWYTSTGLPSEASGGTWMSSVLTIPLRSLWHYTFMALTVDLNTLEIAAGREGCHRIGPDVHHFVQSWVSAPDSKRTLFHALYIQNLVVSTNLRSSTAIHTPRILFSAALCWYCYILYLPSITTPTEVDVSINADKTLEYLTRFPELRLLRMESSSSGPTSNIWHQTMSGLQKLLVAAPAEMKENTLCVLESALRGLGTGGIARRFADLIYIFISGEMTK